MGELQRIQRNRTFVSGRIILNRWSVLDCVVRNRSAKGACLEISSTLGVPELFDLSIGAGNPQRACKVVWRTARKLGVWFVDASGDGAG